MYMRIFFNCIAVIVIAFWGLIMTVGYLLAH